MKEYYDTRAPEYDDWWLGRGRFEGLDRPHWDDDVGELELTVAALGPARTLDVACGTGFLTRHLQGDITGLDQSARMLSRARRRCPAVTFVQGDALQLPFPDGSFERLFTGHFYGHLEQDDRLRFLSEARRVARELVVVDAIARPDRAGDEWQARILNDGSRWDVFKRYFTPSHLCAELGDGGVVLANRWFVVVSA